MFNLFNSQPVELYTFTYGGETYHYTSNNKDFTYKDVVYQSMSISRGSLRRSKASLSENYLTIKINKDSAIPEKFKIIFPANPVWVTLLQVQRDKPDEAGLVIFSGRVRGVDRAGELAELKCDAGESALKRAGLRLNYQLICNHMTFSEGCGLNRDDYQVAGRVESVEGAAVTLSGLPELPDNWLKLGYVVYQDYFYMIIKHEGPTITLLHPAEGLEPGELIRAYAGCDKGLDTCWDKFNNGLNFGGCPFIPGVNPFRWGF